MPNSNPANLETRFQRGESGNRKNLWQKGQSGNPLGSSKLRREFERLLADALVGDDPAARAQELSDLAWAAARKGEAWAIGLLFQRLAPQAIDVRMSRGRDEGDEIDYSKLSDEDIRVIEAILQRQALAGGEGGS